MFYLASLAILFKISTIIIIYFNINICIISANIYIINLYHLAILLLYILVAQRKNYELT